MSLEALLGGYSGLIAPAQMWDRKILGNYNMRSKWNNREGFYAGLALWWADLLGLGLGSGAETWKHDIYSNNERMINTLTTTHLICHASPICQLLFARFSRSLGCSNNSFSDSQHRTHEA